MIKNERAKRQIAALKVPMKPGWPTEPEKNQDKKKREGFKPVPLRKRRG